MADLIVCNLADWNNMVSGKEENCECSTQYCCPGGVEYCSKGEIKDSDSRSVDPKLETSSGEHGVAYQHLEDRAPGDSRKSTIMYPGGSTLIIWAEEHNTIARFFTAALASGAIREDLISGTMFLSYNLPHLNGQTLTAFDNDVVPTEPLSRIFHTLGINDTRGVFVLLNPGLNQVKTCVSHLVVRSKCCM
ncbi:hypothetical protein FALCPG4_008652 [Fusarium falciforme]